MPLARRIAILTTPWDQLDGKVILSAIEKVSLAEELLAKMRAEHEAEAAEHEAEHHHHDHEHAAVFSTATITSESLPTPEGSMRIRSGWN